MTVHKHTLITPRKARRGVTVVQFAFFLVLAAVVTGTSISTFADVRQSARQGQALSVLTRTYLAVQDITGAGSNYGTVDLIPRLDGNNKIPAEARRQVGNADVTMVSPFNKKITVKGNGNTFTITFENYEIDNCKALLKTFANMTAGQAGLESLMVGAALMVGVEVAALRKTEAELDAACDTADGGSVAFEYF